MKSTFWDPSHHPLLPHHISGSPGAWEHSDTRRCTAISIPGSHSTIFGNCRHIHGLENGRMEMITCSSHQLCIVRDREAPVGDIWCLSSRESHTGTCLDLWPLADGVAFEYYQIRKAKPTKEKQFSQWNLQKLSCLQQLSKGSSPAEKFQGILEHFLLRRKIHDNRQHTDVAGEITQGPLPRWTARGH